MKVARYWDDIIANARKTVESGQDIVGVVERVSEALTILKAAVPAGA